MKHVLTYSFEQMDKNEKLFNFKSDIHPKIKFMIEFERDNNINFLDHFFNIINDKHDYPIFHGSSPQIL